jgi:diguanylate cyclase (GGDEF)-like protein
LYWLATKSGCYRIGEEEMLFKAGDRATRFFIIVEGSVGVYSKENNTEYIRAKFVAGDVIGDFDYAHQGAFDATARSGESSLILVFPDYKVTKQQLVNERPDVSARLLLRSVAMISSRIRATQTLISENAPWIRVLRNQMYTDKATGLRVKTFFDEEIVRKVQKLDSVALICLKPDNFKMLCDTYGHKAGDAAMIEIAQILIGIAEKHGGWALRIKSNETALIIPGCQEETTVSICRELADQYTRVQIPEYTGNADIRLSASIAYALWPRDGSSIKKLF